MKPRRLLYGCSALFLLLLAAQITAGYLLLSRWRGQSLMEAAEVVRDISLFSAAALDRTINQTDAMLKTLPVLLRDQIQAGAAAPSVAELIQAQIDQNQALRTVTIFNEAGQALIIVPSVDERVAMNRLEERLQGQDVGLIASPPIYEPRLAEWIIRFSRRIELPSIGAVYATAALSVPILADQIAPAAGRHGVSLSIEGLNQTWLRIPVAPDGNDESSFANLRPSREPEFAPLSSTTKLALSPLTLRVALAPDVALAEWRHDASWILALSGVICVLEITAAAVAFAFFLTRLRARSEMEKATKELRASRQRAQAAADARGIFIANMNHELRTPLNAVIGFSEILTNELFGPIGNPRYRDYAADIHASGAHLLSLINDIIDFSTIDLGHRKLTPEPIALSSALQEAMRLIKPQAAARSLRIEISGVLPDDWVLADARALRQVLVNILSNAIKFSPQEGLVRIVRDYPKGSNALEVSIIDQGPGIPDAEIDKIGEQFYRTAAATESAVGGAGLGLSISMSLMALMDGSIAVKSGRAGGTTMTLRLTKTSARVLEPST